jgi:hypothetical protein
MNNPRRQALKRLQAELARSGVRLSINRLDEVLKRFGSLAVKAIRKTPHGRPNALYVLADYPEGVETLATAIAPQVLQRFKHRRVKFKILWRAHARRGSFELLGGRDNLALGYIGYNAREVYFLSKDDVKHLVKLMRSYRNSWKKGTSTSTIIGGKGRK